MGAAIPNPHRSVDIAELASVTQETFELKIVLMS
uniref:Uncharacterized protein n=1 Tax=Rhizophora mucronata TaxID=61149 RepID=A0A2P2MM96_RHIMU